MARPVYSKRFFGTEFGPSGAATYTVPEGFTAILTDFWVGTGAATAGAILAYLSNPDIGLLWWAIAKGSPDAAELAHVSGRFIVNAGEGITMTNPTSENSNISIHGYLLTS